MVSQTNRTTHLAKCPDWPGLQIGEA